MQIRNGTVILEKIMGQSIVSTKSNTIATCRKNGRRRILIGGSLNSAYEQNGQRTRFKFAASSSVAIIRVVYLVIKSGDNTLARIRVGITSSHFSFDAAIH